MAVHPVAGQPRVVFLRPLVKRPAIEVGEYTYYDHPTRAEHFAEDAVLYAFGSRATDDRTLLRTCCRSAVLLPGANHADQGPSTFPFGIFGPPWDFTMDVVLSVPSRGDTVVGNDVWLGYQALVLPGVTIGHGAVIAAASVVASDVPSYAVVAGNPARVVRRRFDDDVERLLRAAWWDWPFASITKHARSIMTGTPVELEEIAHKIGRLAR